MEQINEIIRKYPKDETKWELSASQLEAGGEECIPIFRQHCENMKPDYYARIRWLIDDGRMYTWMTHNDSRQDYLKVQILNRKFWLKKIVVF